MSPVIGIGVDTVDIDRFRAVLARRDRMSKRLFTPGELSLLTERNDAVPSLAARFAAKEAVMKALSTGLGGVDFADIEVLSLSSGAPSLSLSGRAAARAASLGVTRWHISLTHTDTVASAFVVAD